MSVFYDVRNLSLEKFKDLLIQCYSASSRIRVDKLDCSQSSMRQGTKLTFEQSLNFLKPDCHRVFIDRGEDEFEVGFCEMNSGVNHFLFIFVSAPEARKIIDMWQLRQRT